MVANCIHRVTRTGAVLFEEGWKCLRLSYFLGDTRGGATSYVAASVAFMVVVAGALIVDHTWLFGQRDVIKSASDSAAIAATMEMRRPGILDKFKTDDELKEHLENVATNYMLLNLSYLPEEQFQKAKGSLEIKAKPDRETKTASVSVSADLGGTLFSRELPILGNYKGPEKIGVAAEVEGVSNPIEVVLAVDVSGSMANRLDGAKAKADGSDSRMAIVKGAAEALVDILGPDEEKRIAVGLVPWQALVQLDRSTRQNWEAGPDPWAVYPDRRHFGGTYYCKPWGECNTQAEDQYLLEENKNGETWQGCVGEQRVYKEGVKTLAKLPALNASSLWSPPSATPFAQGIYAGHYGFAYDCIEPSSLGPNWDDIFGIQRCYGTAVKAHKRVYDNTPAQEFCTEDMQPMFPLSSKKSAVEAVIENLKPAYGTTNSSLGILWGRRMLSPGWKSVWGDSVHPVDPASEDGKGARKAIVLLTDGEDNQCGPKDPSCKYNQVGIPRETACSLAKEAGTEIFVIAAMNPQKVSEGLADSLRACSSQADNPTGKYVFINNTNREDLEEAFADIANQLTIFRRVK